VVTSTTHKTLRGPRGGVILTNNEDIYKKINKAVLPGTQGGPLMHVIAAKAVAFQEAPRSDFKQYAKQVVNNAKTLGEELKAHGASLISDGTDTHLILIDLRPWDLTGKEAEKKLEDMGLLSIKILNRMILKNRLYVGEVVCRLLHLQHAV